ncbi:metal-dependent hydrolase [Haloprofundus salilacus]|uniref:metal-dependent hydrolase n=1 Tax=Haloprofundus salilacus TaxID=2876190 RepID=UPI001CCCC011|nr:metal-dependent hydrolase [Haloprofundus salilacus]
MTNAMWFPAHLAVGYLLGVRVRLSLGWCLLGAALPDLVDKSLGLTGIFPAYQTVSHSLFGLAVVGTVLYSTPTEYRKTAGVAFGVGWLSHLGADLLQLTLDGRGAHAAGMLGWPVTHWSNPMVDGSVPGYTDTLLSAVPFLSDGYVSQYLSSVSFPLELLVCLVALALFVAERRRKKRSVPQRIQR